MLVFSSARRAQQGSSPFSALLVSESGPLKIIGKKRGNMRSELVYSAGMQIPNRFLLSTVAMIAVRKLHINTTRVEETANQVFTDVANGSYVQVTLPELKPLPHIDHLLIAAA
jgi:hypothetical protein